MPSRLPTVQPRRRIPRALLLVLLLQGSAAPAQTEPPQPGGLEPAVSPGSTPAPAAPKDVPARTVTDGPATAPETAPPADTPAPPPAPPAADPTPPPPSGPTPQPQPPQRQAPPPQTAPPRTERPSAPSRAPIAAPDPAPVGRMRPATAPQASGDPREAPRPRADGRAAEEVWSPSQDDFGRWEQNTQHCEIEIQEQRDRASERMTCGSVRLEQQLAGLLSIRFQPAGRGQGALSQQVVFAGVLLPGSRPMRCSDSRCEPSWPIRVQLSALASSSVRSLDLPHGRVVQGTCSLEATRVQCQARDREGGLWQAQGHW